jgi:hypothetical protein
MILGAFGAHHSKRGALVSVLRVNSGWKSGDGRGPYILHPLNWKSCYLHDKLMELVGCEVNDKEKEKELS